MSGAAPEGKYQDHYQVLGVAPKATMEEVHQAYQALVKVCHPASGTAPDKEKFQSINEAYEVLSDPATRRMFDEIRPDASKDAPPEFDGPAFFETLHTEKNRRLAVLCLLYDRRRFKPVLGSVSQRHLEQMMVATPEQLQLAMFYLQKRGLVEMNDKSSYLITVDGMDYLEKSPPPPEFVLSMLKQPKREECQAVPAAAAPASAAAEQPAAPPAAPHSDAPAQLAALQTALANQSKPVAPAKSGEKAQEKAAAKPAPPQIKYRFGHQKG
jgi:curved DNA-binding protein CbpA